MTDCVHPADLDGFDRYEFGEGEDRRFVYVRGPDARPAVILLHELPGMAPPCVELAEELSSPHLDLAGYRVHMPLLFGTPNKRAGILESLRNAWCIRNEMHMFKSGTTSPITTWVAALVEEASQHSESNRVAVIGMCLTGGVVFGLLAEPNVAAAVASQPSLPLGLLPRTRRDLGLSDIDRAVSFASSTPLMALRYRQDWRCPRSRFIELTATVGEELPDPPTDRRQDVTLGNLRIIDIPGSQHSVLSIHRDQEAVVAVKDFLAENLATAG